MLKCRKMYKKAKLIFLYKRLPILLFLIFLFLSKKSTFQHLILSINNLAKKNQHKIYMRM